MYEIADSSYLKWTLWEPERASIEFFVYMRAAPTTEPKRLQCPVEKKSNVWKETIECQGENRQYRYVNVNSPVNVLCSAAARNLFCWVCNQYLQANRICPSRERWNPRIPGNRYWGWCDFSNSDCHAHCPSKRHSRGPTACNLCAMSTVQRDGNKGNWK